MKKFLCTVLALTLLISNFALSVSLPAMGSSVSYVVFGDSIATGYGLSTTSLRYSSLIADERGYTLTNKAVNGAKTSGLISLLDTAAAQEAARSADIISISIGGNNALQMSQTDMMQAVLQGVNGTIVQNLLKNIEADLKTIQSKLRKLNSSCKIYYQTVYNSANGTTNSTYKMLEPLMREMLPLANQKYYDVAKTDSNTSVVDVFTAFQQYYDDTGKTDLIQGDWVHPSVKGHRLIADEFLKVLEVPTTTVTTTTTTTTTTVPLNKVRYTVDGSTQLYEKGTVVTLPIGTINGFVGYTDGARYYSAGEEITLNADLTLSSASLAFSMLSGAAMRFNNPTGIRYCSAVDTELIDALRADGAVITTGTIISLDTIIGEQDFTKAMSGKFVDVTYSASKWHTDGNGFIGIAGSIVSIKDGNINKNFIGRGYITVSYGDVSKTIYADYADGAVSNNSRSISYIANRVIIYDYNKLTEENREIAKYYADFYNGKDKYDLVDPLLDDKF